MEIGEKIKQIRKREKLTLKELAQRAGLDFSTISRIERGRKGTLETITRISNALGVKLTELLEGVGHEERGVDFQPASLRTDRYKPSDKFSIEILTTNIYNKKFLPKLYKIEPGEQGPMEENPPGTEKFFFVLRGSVRANVGEESHLLNRGDALYFDASRPHSITNVGNAEAHCMCVVSPVSL